MLITQVVVITDPESFMLGNLNCFALVQDEQRAKDMAESYGWIRVAAVEFEVERSDDEVKSAILTKLEKKESELRSQLHIIETKKKELFSISYQPEPVEPTPENSRFSSDDDVFDLL